MNTLDTKTIRPIVELLTIMLDNLDEHFKLGLCTLSSVLCIVKLITGEEENALDVFIDEHKPIATRYYIECVKDCDYYWERGKIKPRRRWLRKWIKELNNI